MIDLTYEVYLDKYVSPQTEHGWVHDCMVRSAVVHQVECIRKMTDNRKCSLRAFFGLAGSHIIGYTPYWISSAFWRR